MMKRRLLLAFAFAAVAGPAMACTGFAVNVLQTSATSYSPAELTTNRLTIKLSTAGPIDSACDTLTVTVGPHDWDPRPMVLQNGTSELLGSDPGTPNAVRVGRDLQLTPTAVQQLVAGQPIYLDIQDITAGQFVRSGSYVSLITVVAGDQVNLAYTFTGTNLGVSTSSPYLTFSVFGTAIIQGTSAGTSSVAVTSSSATKGGKFIVQDMQGGTCTEIHTQSGVITAAAVTCP